jgi:hypothetical protein
VALTPARNPAAPDAAELPLATGNCVGFADHEALARRQAADPRFRGRLIRDSGSVLQ